MWSSNNLIASRSQAPQWSIRPSLISSPTKHNSPPPPTRLKEGPSGFATYIPQYYDLPTSQLPWEVLLVQKPFSLSGLIPVWLLTLKILCTACLLSMRLSEPYVTVCLWYCVYCNAPVNVCWHIPVPMSGFFLIVVSISCLLVCGVN